MFKIVCIASPDGFYRETVRVGQEYVAYNVRIDTDMKTIFLIYGGDTWLWVSCLDFVPSSEYTE